MQRRDCAPARVEVAPVAGRVLEPAQLRDLVAQLREQPFDLLFLSSLRFVAHRARQRTVKTPFMPAEACPGTVHE